MSQTASYRSRLWWAAGLVVGEFLALSVGLAVAAQMRSPAPQPARARAPRATDNPARQCSLFAASPGTHNVGLAPVELQTLQFRFDYTGVYLNTGDQFVFVRGATTMPPGKQMMLNLAPPLSGDPDFSWLSMFSPNDLYSLQFPLPWPSKRKPGDSVLPHITRLTGLKCLQITDTEITAKGLRQLAQITSLERLNLPLGVTDEGLAEVARLPNLRALGGCHGHVTDQGLAILARMPALEELEISSSRITDAGLAHLTKLPRLRFLQLWGSSVTDAGMAQVARIPSLRVLNLAESDITDAGLAELAKAPRLEALNLSNTPVTDAGMAHLRSLHSLKTLQLAELPRPRRDGSRSPSRVHVTDTGVIHLCEIESLEYLGLVTSDEVLPYLCTLPRIKCLHAGSDPDLVRISKVTSLEYVTVGGDLSTITDAGLAYLARLKNLQKLNLSLNNESHVSDCLAQVARLTSLKTLNIFGAGARIMVSDLKQLNPLSNLVFLNVYTNIQQDETGLDLSGLASLEYLNLRVGPGAPRFADRDLTTISKLANLQELSMMENDFTNEAKARVARLPKLKSWVGVDLNAIRAGQPERLPVASKPGAAKTSGKPQAPRGKPR